MADEVGESWEQVYSNMGLDEPYQNSDLTPKTPQDILRERDPSKNFRGAVYQTLLAFYQ